MTQTDSQYLIERLDQIEKHFGIWIAFSIIGAIIIAVISFRLLIKKTEKIIDEKSEKSLKSFQGELDKDFFKFQTRHEKQIDSVHLLFQKFRRLNTAVNLLIKGENFVVVTNVREEINHLISYRHNFKIVYDENKIVLAVAVCQKIDAFFPALDEFIQTFANGIMPDRSQEETEFNAEQNGGFVISGLWRAETFEPILEQLSFISQDIEMEFRKLYGTAE